MDLKQIILFLYLLLSGSTSYLYSQDTLYIYRSGMVINKHAVNEVDSLAFRMPKYSVSTDPRQDSLKKIISADYVFSIDVTVPLNCGFDGVEITLDEAKLCSLFGYASARALSDALGMILGEKQNLHEVTFFGYDFTTKNKVLKPSTTYNFGHWFNQSGDVCIMGPQAHVYVEKTNEYGMTFKVGNFLNRTTVGSVYHIAEGMSKGDMEVAILFNVTIGPSDGAFSDPDIKASIDLETTIPADTTYASLAPVPIPVFFMTQLLGVPPQDAELYGVNANDSLYRGPKAAYNGWWFNAAGNVCKWGDKGCALYVEYNSKSNEINFCQFPNGCQVGQTYHAKMAFVNQSAQITIGFSIKIDNLPVSVVDREKGSLHAVLLNDNWWLN